MASRKLSDRTSCKYINHVIFSSGLNASSLWKIHGNTENKMVIDQMAKIELINGQFINSLVIPRPNDE